MIVKRLIDNIVIGMRLYDFNYNNMHRSNHPNTIQRIHTYIIIRINA